jgi:transcriptional regulator with XRE-family HTH domain
MTEQTTTAPLEIIAASLRRERDRAGLSLTELAKRAGVAKSTLSQLESGSGNPSVETLWALAVTLDVPFSRLVEPPAPHVKIIRNGEAPAVRSEQSSMLCALLSSCPAGARRDLHLLSMEPGDARHASSHLPGTIEHIIVTAGRVRTGPEDRPVELAPGDYASFSGNTPHLYEALEPASTAVLVMEHV